jgi:uncharacterized protein YbjT (DUF2867 family)
VDDLPTTRDLEYVLTFARAAKRAGAIRFLLMSSLGADASSRFLYLRLKGEAEAGVSALGFSELELPALLSWSDAGLSRASAKLLRYCLVRL